MTEEEMLKRIPTPDWVNDFKFKDEDFIYHSDTVLRIMKEGMQKKMPLETCEELQSFIGEAIEWHKKHIPCCGKGFFFQKHDCQKISPQEPLPWDEVIDVLKDALECDESGDHSSGLWQRKAKEILNE